MEAFIGGIAGMAVSLHAPEEFQGKLDYAPAARMAKQIITMLNKDGAVPHFLLNVNIPCLPVEEMKGVMITRQGLRVYRDRLDRRVDPRGRPYYWIGGDSPTAIPDEGTDFGALEQGYISVTPLHLDLTDFEAMKSLDKMLLDK